MNYDIKTGPEGIWLAVQTAAAGLTGWALDGNTDMDTVLIVIVAGAVGSVARPVLGYLIGFLPKRKPDLTAG